MGSVGRPKSVLFSIGLTQRNAIQFLGNGDIIQKLPSLWTHYWRTGSDAVCSVFSMFVENAEPI
jgi:hypothetical protein